MKKAITKIFYITAILTVQISFSWSQVNPTDFDKEEAKQVILSEVADRAAFIPEIEVTYQYSNSRNGIQYTYFQQLQNGVEVYKAIGNIAKKGGQQFLKTGRLVLDKDKFMNESQSVEPAQSVRIAARHLGLPFANTKGNLARRKNNQYELTGLPFAKDKVSIRQVWAPDTEGLFPYVLGCRHPVQCFQ